MFTCPKTTKKGNSRLRLANYKAIETSLLLLIEQGRPAVENQGQGLTVIVPKSKERGLSVTASSTLLAEDGPMNPERIILVDVPENSAPLC